MYEFVNFNNFADYFNGFNNSANSNTFTMFGNPSLYSASAPSSIGFAPYSNCFNFSGGFSELLVPSFSMPSFSSMSFNNSSSNNWMNCWNNIGATSFSWNNISNTTTTSSTTNNTRTDCKTAQDYRNRTVAKARSYIGKVNSDAEGNRLFSPSYYKTTPWYRKNGGWGWCADFATYVAKEIYGDKLPSGFKNSSPQCVINWAKKNSCYSVPPSSNKGSWIAQNVKPGDIMISKGNGPSGLHVAIVSKVNSDGSFETIDGNSKNSVRSVKRGSNGNYKGFISLDKFVA